MKRIAARSPSAAEASGVIEGIQHFFVERLNRLSTRFGEGLACQPVEWFRDEGRHGGGVRYVAADASLFNRASVNYSQVHYDDMLDKRLASATAVSTIIHPRHPHAPSMHMHISWTEMREGTGYWRIMGDLNPSLPDENDRQRFLDTFKTVSGSYYEEGLRQGDRYFHIPALGRHRGVAHFYLEQFSTGNAEADMAFASSFGEAVISTYIAIVSDALDRGEPVSDADLASQLAYHTTYLLQVLTLDRGTTSGLLVHDQNDVGIMGSIPSHVDTGLLRAWQRQLPEIQQPLLQAIIEALDGEGVVLVDDRVKSRLAAAVRGFYRTHPEALSYQASGNVIPDTVNNHQASRQP